MRQLGFVYSSMATRLPANRPVAFRLCLTTGLAFSLIISVFKNLSYHTIIEITSPFYHPFTTFLLESVEIIGLRLIEITLNF